MIATDRDFEVFVKEHEARVRPLFQEAAQAWWMASTTGEKAYEEQSARCEADLRKLYANPVEYHLVREVLERAVLGDALLRREARVLRNAYLGNQMPPDEIEAIVRLEKEIESDFNNYRAQVGAGWESGSARSLPREGGLPPSVEQGVTLTDNEIKEVLRKDDDAGRRQAAWEGSKQIGARVSERVLRLVGMRNESARRLGFRDFFAMQLELQDLEEGRLFGLLDELATRTDSVWKTFKERLDAGLRARFGVDRLEPWHYSDPFFQELPPSGDLDLDPWFAGKQLEDLTRAFYHAIGLEIDDILARSDLYEKPGKCQHAFCISIDRADDVRVLCNLKSDEYWMSTMLHELGHAVYDKYIDRALPFVVREPAHTLFTEAVAMFMGRLTKDERWLQRYAGVGASEAAAAGAVLRAQMREQLLVFVRWALVVTHFEQAMYRDPSQDLDALWWQLVERYQGVSRPAGRRAPDWASKIHIATAPVYYQNYVLGEMVASQMLHHLMSRVLADAPDPREALVSDTRVGAWFVTQIFHPGNSAHWEETLERASGEALHPAYLVDWLVQG